MVFRRSFRRNQKDLCLNACRFVAHLVNLQVVHEIMALEILTLLLENPTDDSVEVAVGFIKEVGLKLSEVSPRALGAIFERLRNILHEASIDKRTQYMIEVLFAIRKDNFAVSTMTFRGVRCFSRSQRGLNYALRSLKNLPIIFNLLV